MGRTTWINRGHFYVPHVSPVLVDCNFIVDATNGLGINSLKGQGVANVFMHTSGAPTRGSNGYLNPNPANGNILVQLSDNFNRYYGGFSQLSPPVTGSIKIDNGATLTVGNSYVISVVGDATAAQWLTVGVPPGVVPAVGVSFIAIATGAGAGNTSTSRVSTPTIAGVETIEVVGDPNKSLGPIPVGGSPNVGSFILLQALAATSAGVTTQIPTAPAAGSLIRLAFYLSQSSVLVSGE